MRKGRAGWWDECVRWVGPLGSAARLMVNSAYCNGQQQKRTILAFVPPSLCFRVNTHVRLARSSRSCACRLSADSGWLCKDAGLVPWDLQLDIKLRGPEPWTRYNDSRVDIREPGIPSQYLSLLRRMPPREQKQREGGLLPRAYTSCALSPTLQSPDAIVHLG